MWSTNTLELASTLLCSFPHRRHQPPQETESDLDGSSGQISFDDSVATSGARSPSVAEDLAASGEVHDPFFAPEPMWRVSGGETRSPKREYQARC